MTPKSPITFHNACRAIVNLSIRTLNNKFHLETYKVLPQYQRKEISVFNTIIFQRVQDYQILKSYNPNEEDKSDYLRRLKALLVTMGGTRKKAMKICNNNYDSWVSDYMTILILTCSII